MNTFYYYYTKQSDRFYVAIVLPDQSKTKVQYVWEPMARKVVIPEFDEYDFFVFGKTHYAVLYEALTGMAVIRQTSMQTRPERRANTAEFIQLMNRELKRRGGHSALNKAMNDFLTGTGQFSPRYVEKTVKETK